MKMKRVVRMLLVIGVTTAVISIAANVTQAKSQAIAPNERRVSDQTPPASAPERPESPESPESPERPLPPQRRGQAGALRVPDEVQVVRDVVYSTAKTDAGEPIDLKLDAAFLKESDGQPMPVVIYIHGGGWHSGSKQSGLQQSIALAMGGYFAVTIDYRLSGQAKFPAAVDDCKNAVRFVRQHAEELGIDPNRIGVWGHSAGGHLSALLGTSGDVDSFAADFKNDKTTARQSSAVQCVVNISGPVDLRGDGEGNPIGQWLGGTPDQRADLAKRASPLTYIDQRDPPVLIVHGTEDRLVNIRQAELFEKALREAKVSVAYVPVKGAGHAIVQPGAYVRVAEFFDEYLGGNAAEYVRMFQRGRNQPEPPAPASQPG